MPNPAVVPYGCKLPASNALSQVGKEKGIVGAVPTDSVLASRFRTTVYSLHDASVNAQKMTGTRAQFLAKLNTRDTLVNELVTDTTVFRSQKAPSVELRKAASWTTDVVNNAKRANETSIVPTHRHAAERSGGEQKPENDRRAVGKQQQKIRRRPRSGSA